jgi:hypothetical protein
MFEQKTVHIQKQKIPFDTLEPLVSVVDFQFTKKKHINFVEDHYQVWSQLVKWLIYLTFMDEEEECEVMTLCHMIICKGNNQWSFMYNLILSIQLFLGKIFYSFFYRVLCYTKFCDGVHLGFLVSKFNLYIVEGLRLNIQAMFLFQWFSGIKEIKF